MRTSIINILGILSRALKLFTKNDPLRMAGATAYFTMFALPAILIIIVQVFGFLMDPRSVKHGLFTNLSGIFGQEATRQIVSVIRAFRAIPYNLPATIIGFAFIVFVATTVFKVIINCIDQIWNIGPTRSKRFMKTIHFRLNSVLMILVAGLLFSAGIFIEAMELYLGNYFTEIFSSIPSLLAYAITFTTSTILVAAWFVIVFRYLPDGRPKWRVAIVGSLFTSFLFSIGRIVLHALLTQQNVNTVYGTSASIVLLLLFLFYTAMILYYGAAFTTVYAQFIKQPIQPRNGDVSLLSKSGKTKTDGIV